jgi:hypothetical protein
MDEVIVGEFAFPEDDAVVSVAGDEAVKHFPLAFVMGDVAHGEEGAASGDGGDGGHADVVGGGHELGHVGGLDEGIVAHGIVVGGFFPVRPFIGAFEGGFVELEPGAVFVLPDIRFVEVRRGPGAEGGGEFIWVAGLTTFADEGESAGAEGAEDFGGGKIFEEGFAGAGADDDIDGIFGVGEGVEATVFDGEALDIEAGVVGLLAEGLDGGGAGFADVDVEFGGFCVVAGEGAVAAEDGAEAAVKLGALEDFGGEVMGRGGGLGEREEGERES